MSTPQLREKAIELSRQACEADRQENYEEALKLYKLAIKHFLHLSKYETNPVLKQNFSDKTREYLERAEKISEYLAKKDSDRAPVLTSGAREERKGNGNGASGGQGEDDANSNLKKGLEGAIVTEKPNVKWTDIAGLEGAKGALQEAVILPTRFPELFVGKRTPWKGILLYGPPGTGKSYLAKACATEADGTFFSVSSSDLVSKFLGESERLVRSLFEMARASRPAIIFIDEIDSLCGSRSEGENDAARRIKTEFLVQMQGVGHNEDGILVLGATNIPWELDSAIRRRFERRIYIPLPDQPARAVMFRLNIGDTPNNLTEEDFDSLASHTEGFSGSDIATMVKSALMEPVRKCHKARFFKKVNATRSTPGARKQDDHPSGKVLYTPCPPSDPEAIEMTLMQVPQNCLLPPQVEAEDFYRILDSAKTSVSEADLLKHQEFTETFGMEGN